MIAGPGCLCLQVATYNWQTAETILNDLLHATTNQLEFEL